MRPRGGCGQPGALTTDVCAALPRPSLGDEALKAQLHAYLSTHDAGAPYPDGFWTDVASHVPGRDARACRKRCVRRQRPFSGSPGSTAALAIPAGMRMSPLTPSHRHTIARMHSSDRRWTQVLDPALVHAPWTSDEIAKLLSLHVKHQGKWARMARDMPGR